MRYSTRQDGSLSRASGQTPSKWSLRKGAAAAEFAILCPFLFFLIIGTFEVARGIMIKQMLNDAARKSCRTGILPARTNTNVTQEINNILTDNQIPTSDATISILVSGTAADVSTARPGLDSVSVKISIPIGDVYWFGTFFLSASAVDSDFAVMMKQG